MDLSGVVWIADSRQIRSLVGLSLLVGWVVGEGVILSRSGVRQTRSTLPLALLRTFARRRTEPSQDRGSGVVILVALYAWMLSTWGGFIAQIGGLPWPLFYGGLVLAPVGIAIRLWALVVLGRNFSVVVSTSADQTLIRSGPYRSVRHPSYTGILLLALGFPLLLLSGFGLLAGAVAVPVALGYRIRVEEQALLARFGSAYEEYRATSWRLFPHLV